VQIIVYTGAIMMLFLFVLMLVGVDASDSLVETIRGQRVAAALVGVGFVIALLTGLAGAVSTYPDRSFAGRVARVSPVTVTAPSRKVMKPTWPEPLTR